MTSGAPQPSRRELLTGQGWNSTDPADKESTSLPPFVSGDTIRLETRAMGCLWNIILNPGPPQQVMAASDAFQVVHNLEAQLTIYRSDSELNALNRSAVFGEWFPVSPGLFVILQQCRELHLATDGAFDPVTRPLTALWRECRRLGRIPTASEVEHAHSWCGLQYVDFNAEQSALRFRFPGQGSPPLEIGFDLGAIGKGAGIDAAAQHLLQGQITDFLIHGGYSSVWGSGMHAQLPGWPVGIKNPLFSNRRLATWLLSDVGLSSSGSNVQFFRHEGQRYGHILDPRTGWPSETLLSVSVTAPTAAQADALSTAFYVMGLDKAAAYCHHHPEIAALLIPLPQGNRTLQPVFCNIPEGGLQFASEVAGG